MIVYEYDLDMVPGLTQGRTVVSLSQYDDNFFINFHLYTRNGSFVIESGTTARIRGTKPDGNGFSATATVDASDMTVLVEGDKQMTAAAGTSQYELTLMKGTKELNTANFDVYIERAALDIDTPASETKLRELYDLPVDEILQAATTAVDAKDDAEDARDAAIAAKDEAVSVTDGLMEIVRGSFIYETASGSMASFSDGGDGLPVKSVSVDVDPVQDLHGYSKPWTGGAGKNLFNVNATTQTINGMTFTVNSDGTVRVNGTATANTDFMLSNSSFSIPAGHYILSGSPQGGTDTTYYLAFFVDSSWQSRDYGNGLDKQVNTSITNAAISVRNGTTINNLIFKPMIRLASVSDATFEPYSNICPITGHTSATITRDGADSSQTQTYNITFPTAAGTVYGGTLDSVHGTLWVDRAMKTFLWSEFDGNSELGDYRRGTKTGLSPVPLGLSTKDISNVAVYLANWEDRSNHFYIDSNSKVLVMVLHKDTPESTEIQVCYELATPITYNLTAEEITTLLGINHIWADTGDVSVEYAADPKLYINKVIANALNA